MPALGHTNRWTKNKAGFLVFTVNFSGVTELFLLPLLTSS